MHECQTCEILTCSAIYERDLQSPVDVASPSLSRSRAPGLLAWIKHPLTAELRDAFWQRAGFDLDDGLALGCVGEGRGGAQSDGRRRGPPQHIRPLEALPTVGRRGSAAPAPACTNPQ